MKRAKEFFVDKETIESLIGAVYEGMLIADHDAIVRYVNDSYLEIANIKREDIINKPLSEVRPGSVLPQVIRTGEGRVNIFRNEGDTVYVVDLSPIKMDGKIIGGISVVKGLVQAQELSKELEKYIAKTQELKDTVHRAYQAYYTFDDIVGASDEYKKVIAMAKKMAGYDEDVLIIGESGTGKELFAHAIHNYSHRFSQPFVAVNCSTLSPSLIESELFGYKAGSFTGALKGGKVGLFSIADKGTILLDEIAELPLEMQAKFLRVLQERKIRRVGDLREEDINVRVIAATNKDLKQLTNEGKFREDLYYRLSAMTLEVPNLQKRKDDLKLLADYFLHQWCKRRNRQVTITTEVYERMKEYTWPGNVRELKNVVQFSAYASENNIITELNLPKTTSKESAREETSIPQYNGRLKDIIADTERRVIHDMIKKYGDSVINRKLIAEKLGISLATLYNKAK